MRPPTTEPRNSGRCRQRTLRAPGWSAIRRSTIWRRSTKLQRDRGGFSQRGGRGAAAAGDGGGQPAGLRTERQQTATRRQRWHGRRPHWPTRRPIWRRRARWWRRPRFMPRWRERSIASMRARTEFVEQGKLLLQLADLHHERVRAYFDEPEIGRLAVGQKIRDQVGRQAGPGLARTHRAHSGNGDHLRHAQRGRSAGEIDDADGGLLPDTNVTVTVTTSSEPNALSIPREALHSREWQDLRLSKLWATAWCERR